MNLRRGLWRLWIITSIVLVICMCLVSCKSVAEEFRIAHTDYDAMAKELGSSSLLPADCPRSSAGSKNRAEPESFQSD
jgi:hypothetical protein